MGIIGNDGRIKKVNSRWTDILGWTSEELLSLKYPEIMHPEDVEKDKSKKNSYENSKGVLQIKNRLLCKNGDYKWFEFRVKYIEEERVYFITAKDSTEKEMLEEGFHLESIKNEFFANISHEFKTPLNIILGTEQLITKNIEQGRICYNDGINLKKHMKSIKQNSYRLLILINNLIDITRVDNGYYKLSLGNYNIISIIEDIAMSVSQYAEYKGIELIFDTEVEESIVACDPDKMERIVLNILSNAIKYTPENGEIKVNIKDGKDKIRVSIKDSGIGIPSEKIDIIFERYGQAHSSIESRCEGSGIGLSLVKSLVEMHGGSISAYSEVGKGSEFIFDIPTILVDDEENLDIIINHSQFQIKKCNIEFSDIYSI